MTVIRPSFRIEKGSLQDRFLKSRAKIQFYGGGFANGKTSASCIKALMLAKEYPGSNGLIARSTYPKLEDTIKKELLKWCPKHWIKSKTDKPNNITFENGSVINFRYVSQQGKGTESTTSNLLSATYDWIIVDQIEDPEFVHKDFLDLMGRLRGMARRDPSLPYDPTMPESGPRWLIITANPTRNWVYTELIKPVHDYYQGRVNEKLVKDDDGKPLIEIFEGSTYENASNLEPDFIKGLESTYTGQMRERFLLGKWGAFEGLVYPDFNEDMHVINEDRVFEYFHRLRGMGVTVQFLQGYDYGISSPSCYLLSFVDTRGNIIICDGYYETTASIPSQAQNILRIQERWGVPPRTPIYADPQIFRKTMASRTLVGQSVSEMFAEDGVATMVRGNNDIQNGIVKVTSYLALIDHHLHPIHSISPSPRLYTTSKLEQGYREFSTYRWKKDTAGDETDKPIDKDDHFVDTVKYMLSHEPKIGRPRTPWNQRQVGLRHWAEEAEDNTGGRKVRYG